MDTDRLQGRSCGGCTVCCHVLPIDTPELRKRPGIACTHCGAQGCTIYETRFPICRSYYCGWHYLAALGPEWRPDLSGVLVSPRQGDVPPGYPEEGIEFLVLGGEKAVRRRGFAAHIAEFVAKGIPVHIAVPGPPGYFAAHVFVNETLKRAVARRDHGAVTAALLRILKAAVHHDFVPMAAGADEESRP